MATTRLTDIVAAMKSKWTYGDKDFDYEFEINQNHNIKYPYMMIVPPNSQIPEVYNGWEAYNFEIDFFDLYQTSAQKAVSLEQKWDNLQDLALEWLNNVMINFNNPTGAGVGVYFLEESIDIERVKEVANDRLIQIKMSFTMRGVTKCMFGSIPETYPNQIPNLSVWLKADSGVAFNNSTRKISSWEDQSENNNNVSQATTTKQPLRYNYDGASDKTRINFDGTTDYLVSDNNCPLTGNDLTIFYIGKADELTSNVQRVVGYRDSAGGGSDRLNFGIDNNTGRVYFKALDDNSNGGQVLSAFLDRGLVNHIACAKIEGTEFSLQYNNNTEITDTFVYSNANGFNLAPFTIGYIDAGSVGAYWTGDIQEVIIYNRALSTYEISNVRDYLNNKYKIY